MATGLSALSAVHAWITKQVRDWKAERPETKAGNRLGYVEPTGI
jgi:hypothetical protein